MVRVLLKADLYGPTVVNVAFTDVDAIATAFIGTSRVLASVDVDRPLSPCSMPCSSRKPGIVPSSSGFAPRSWRLLLVE